LEPLLRVEAPIIEAQIVETFLLATINFQTSIASKAARVVTAAKGADVIEFGTRRAHGSEAGLFAARAAFIGGCAGTSNVEAGYLFGIPIFGTLAHSFIMSFDDEDEAFRAFLRVFPDTATILVDTYDSIAAVERLAHNFDKRIAAVRLDSGDLLELSRHARRTLDEGGMTGTRIFASGDLDEYRIAELLAANAPIDAFGVGTQLATSYDAPALGGVYKLVGLSVDGHKKMRMKLSTGKATYPGAKQIWRLVDKDGRYVEDRLCLIDELQPQRSGLMAKALLEPVMKDGRAIEARADNDAGREGQLSRLLSARSLAKDELSRLPGELLALDAKPSYPVGVGEGLEAVTRKLSGAR
jgi:nicotinate phosphoribosyltransferase